LDLVSDNETTIRISRAGFRFKFPYSGEGDSDKNPALPTTKDGAP
jgi:hypothetical protein